MLYLFHQNNVRGEFQGPSAAIVKARTERAATKKLLNHPAIIQRYCECCGYAWGNPFGGFDTKQDAQNWARSTDIVYIDC